MDLANGPTSSLSCFNCDEDSPLAHTTEEAEELASSQGWVIGLGMDPCSNDTHMNAVYACQSCSSLLLDPLPIRPLGEKGKSL